MGAASRWPLHATKTIGWTCSYSFQKILTGFYPVLLTILQTSQVFFTGFYRVIVYFLIFLSMIFFTWRKKASTRCLAHERRSLWQLLEASIISCQCIRRIFFVDFFCGWRGGGLFFHGGRSGWFGRPATISRSSRAPPSQSSQLLRNGRNGEEQTHTHTQKNETKGKKMISSSPPPAESIQLRNCRTTSGFLALPYHIGTHF